MEKLFKVTAKGGKPAHGGSGQWYLPKNGKPGKWMPFIEDIVPCESGYHLCKPEHLLNWLHEEIWIAEYRGKIIEQEDKIVVQQARLIAPTRWNERTARLFAADCVAHVLPIWEKSYPDDKRPHKTIEIARQFANGQATMEELVAVRNAAWASSRYALAHRSEAESVAAAAGWATAGDVFRYAARNAVGAAAGAVYWESARTGVRTSDLEAEREWQISCLLEYLEGGLD